MCELCHWHVHWHISHPKELTFFNHIESFCTSSIYLFLFLYCLPNHSIFMLSLKHSILIFLGLFTQLHWRVDLEELLLLEGKTEDFLVNSRHCRAQVPCCSTAFVLSIFKKIDREAENHLLLLQEIMTQQVTSIMVLFSYTV